MDELLCTWVPGTIDIVRLRGSGRTIELTSTRLARIFGPRALDELYLKGRAVVKANPQQVALLARARRRPATRAGRRRVWAAAFEPEGPAPASMGGMEPDLQAMLADLRALVEIESPSTDPVAVGRVMDVVEGRARGLGAATHALPGGSRRFDFGVGGPEPGERLVLVLAHADTVWPTGTLATMPFRVEGERAYGPGTYDMKGGIVGLLHALRALGGQSGGQWPRGGVQVLLTPDEETGSHGSREAIEAAARGARAVLVIEPPVADSHALKVGRKGVGSFGLTFRGVASHAGNKPGEGASAITEAARAVLEVQALARPDEGTTVSVGLIRGGSAVNVIPAECRLEVDVRVSTAAEAERVNAGFAALRPRDGRVRLDLTGGLNRPTFERGPGTEALFARAQALARDLGFEVGGEVVGGGSDGNFTAPLCPTLDGLGAPGDGAHAAHEHVRLDRWPDHVRLLARLLREV